MELFLCMFTLLIYYIIKFALMHSSKNVYFVCSFHFTFNALSIYASFPRMSNNIFSLYKLLCILTRTRTF
jgi:hypothetical protein